MMVMHSWVATRSIFSTGMPYVLVNEALIVGMFWRQGKACLLRGGAPFHLHARRGRALAQLDRDPGAIPRAASTAWRQT